MEEPVVPAYWITGIANQVEVERAVLEQAFELTRIPRDVIEDPTIPVTYAQELAFIDTLARLTGKPTFGAEAGGRVDPRRTSLLSYLVFNAPTLGHGLRNVERYLRLVRVTAATRLLEERETVRIVIDNEDPLIHRNPQHAEFVAGATVHAMQVATGLPVSPTEIFFQHERHEARDEVAGVLGAPVQFGCGEFAIVLDRGVLDIPLTDQDTTLLAILERHADSLLAEQQGAPATFRHKVERVVLANLQRGVLPSSEVAAELGTSLRTLARRLDAEGATYRSVVDSVRRRLAESYLSDRALSLAEIAFLLGFSDQGNFTTAFKRWTGATPGSWRAALPD